MLKSLSISNYVIMARANLQFGSGLNMLTGETGAGKSIILGALGLVLGRRADTQVLLDPEKKAIVEAVFSDPAEQTRELLQSADIEIHPDVILRREIASNGRSRAFINDTPVTLDVLSQAGALLVDIHEQFDTLEIQQAWEQYALLDAWSKILPTVVAYRDAFQTYTDLKARLRDLQQQQAEALREKDYLAFQLNEFETLPIEKVGLAAMEEEFRMQSGAEEIHAVTHTLMEQINGDQGFADRLQGNARSLAKLAAGSQKLGSFVQRLEELIGISRDLSHDLMHFSEELEPDPNRRQQLEEKLNTINRIMLKHGVTTEEALMEVKDRLQAQFRQWTNLDTEIERCQKEIATLEKELTKTATTISASRKSAAPRLAENVSKALQDLSMKHARLEIKVADSDNLHLNGRDIVEFLFAPNLGSEPKPIKKVASGGELSRLNLCLKSAVSGQLDLPTLVFDEIDAGVSGEVAMRMGQKLKTLAERHQVIMITHSPQIAAQAGVHLQVVKSDSKGRSIAEVRTLEKTERITEIAKMLSGDPPTKAAIQNAKTLIET